HVPFCTVRCSYCAFNVYIHLEHLIHPFVTALLREIEITGKANPGLPVHTIYFGGGTPTLLTAEQFEQILEAIDRHFHVDDNAEISTEANPDDLLDANFTQQLRGTGINRLSIGVQSTVQSELEMFGRLHDADTVAQAVSNSRAAGFNSLNLDLMYGNPQQTLPMWEQSLQDTIALNPDHFSLYALGLEPNTAMDYWVNNGKLPHPDEDLAADMYDIATAVLANNGFGQYEISNWANPGHESRHNLQYWYNAPYLGLGPGAHGYAGGVRYHNIRSPHKYIKALHDDRADWQFPLTPVIAESTEVSRDDEISETIMMGMRLLHEGLSLAGFEHRFGVSLLDIRGDVIARYEQQGGLTLTDDRLLLTERGRLVSNRILRDLI
ncbi:MAG: radical SAM family heme chaperone HemW, partial [Chloroflexota bacterium]